MKLKHKPDSIVSKRRQLFVAEAARIHSVYCYCSGIGFVERTEYLQKRSLTRPRSPCDSNYLIRCDM